MQAVRCLVCEGLGYNLYKESGSIESAKRVPCHGCGGKGWVETRKDDTVFVVNGSEGTVTLND